MLLAACLLHDPSNEAKPNDPREQSVTDQLRAIDLSVRPPLPSSDGTSGNPRPSQPEIFLGDTTASVKATSDTATEANGSGFDLNFENAPVTTVAKVILGDILGVGYTIDPRVQGTITLSSGRPIAKADALFFLETFCAPRMWRWFATAPDIAWSLLRMLPAATSSIPRQRRRPASA